MRSTAASTPRLWHARLANIPNGILLTYSVDSVQYVAIVAGGGTIRDAYMTASTPEYPASTAAKTIIVFTLPETERKDLP